MRLWHRLRVSRRPRVWLHVGLPKCGSTTIQRHFAGNDAAYRRRGLCYPVAHRLADGYRSHRPLSGYAGARLPDAVADIAREATGARHVLISDEEFANMLPGGGLPPLAAALNARFGADRVTVVLYLRHPVDFVESAYAQFLVAGLFRVHRDKFYRDGPPTIARFVEAARGTKGFQPYSLRGWIAAAIAAAPDNRVIARSLEDLGSGELIGDLCDVIGVRPVPAGRARRNARVPSRRVAAFAYAQTLADQDAIRPLRAALHDLPLSDAPVVNDALTLPCDLRAEVTRTAGAEAPWLRAACSTPIEGLLAPRPAHTGPPTELTEAERARIRALIAGVGARTA